MLLCQVFKVPFVTHYKACLVQSRRDIMQNLKRGEAGERKEEEEEEGLLRSRITIALSGHGIRRSNEAILPVSSVKLSISRESNQGRIKIDISSSIGKIHFFPRARNRAAARLRFQRNFLSGGPKMAFTCN